jgi:hypothetical protein
MKVAQPKNQKVSVSAPNLDAGKHRHVLYRGFAFEYVYILVAPQGVMFDDGNTGKPYFNGARQKLKRVYIAAWRIASRMNVDIESHHRTSLNAPPSLSNSAHL